MTVDPRRALPLATVASGATDLSAALRTRTARGALSVCGPGDALTCSACAHRCVFPRGSGRAGACGVRFEHEGELRVPFGYVARMYTRPVETNTIYHVLPGSLALTFGMYGCDLRCPYCQNARISQALREPVVGEAPIDVSPDDVIGLAVNSGCRVVCAAYNEPAIAAEWVHAIFARAKARGLVTAMITDGHATREVLAFLRPVTDVYRVDLKGADQATYRTLGGRLDPVLDAIRHAKELGFWVEVVTLLVPGLNDDLGPLAPQRVPAAVPDEGSTAHGRWDARFCCWDRVRERRAVRLRREHRRHDDRAREYALPIVPRGGRRAP